MQQVQFFDGRTRRGNKAQGIATVRLFQHPQRACRLCQRGRPIDLNPAAAVLDHGSGQTIFSIEPLIGKTVAVGQPTFIERRIVCRQDAQHAAILDLHGEVRAQTIVRANAQTPAQLPATGTVAERFGGQRADRAQVDDITGQLAVDLAFQERHHLDMLAPTGHAQFHLARNLLPETNTTAAMDAAGHVSGHQRPQILLGHDAFRFAITALDAAIAHRDILQLALTALVADRAIERMVDQQKLHHALLCVDGVLRTGLDLHAVGDRGRTRGQGLGRLLDLNQTHATRGGNRQLLVITKVRDVDAQLLRGLNQRGAGRNFNLFVVNRN